MNQYTPYMQMPQHYEIIRVNGEASAKNFRMAPNSSALLLDETAPIVWFAQTDGAGYLQVTPFDITPHQAQQPVDLNDLMTRVQRLEEQYVQQSNSVANAKSRKQQQQRATNEPANTTT